MFRIAVLISALACSSAEDSAAVPGVPTGQNFFAHNDGRRTVTKYQVRSLMRKEVRKEHGSKHIHHHPEPKVSNPHSLVISHEAEFAPHEYAQARGNGRPVVPKHDCPVPSCLQYDQASTGCQENPFAVVGPTMTLGFAVKLKSTHAVQMIRADNVSENGGTKVFFKHGKLTFAVKGNSPHFVTFSRPFKVLRFYKVSLRYDARTGSVKLFVGDKFKEKQHFTKATAVNCSFGMLGCNEHKGLVLKGAIQDFYMIGNISDLYKLQDRHVNYPPDQESADPDHVQDEGVYDDDGEGGEYGQTGEEEEGEHEPEHDRYGEDDGYGGEGGEYGQTGEEEEGEHEPEHGSNGEDDGYGGEGGEYGQGGEEEEEGEDEPEYDGYGEGEPEYDGYGEDESEDYEYSEDEPEGGWAYLKVPAKFVITDPESHTEEEEMEHEARPKDEGEWNGESDTGTYGADGGGPSDGDMKQYGGDGDMGPSSADGGGTGHGDMNQYGGGGDMGSSGVDGGEPGEGNMNQHGGDGDMGAQSADGGGPAGDNMNQYGGDSDMGSSSADGGDGDADGGDGDADGGDGDADVGDGDAGDSNMNQYGGDGDADGGSPGSDMGPDSASGDGTGAGDMNQYGGDGDGDFATYRIDPSGGVGGYVGEGRQVLRHSSEAIKESHKRAGKGKHKGRGKGRSSSLFEGAGKGKGKGRGKIRGKGKGRGRGKRHAKITLASKKHQQANMVQTKKQ